MKNLSPESRSSTKQLSNVNHRNSPDVAVKGAGSGRYQAAPDAQETSDVRDVPHDDAKKRISKPMVSFGPDSDGNHGEEDEALGGGDPYYAYITDMPKMARSERVSTPGKLRREPSTIEVDASGKAIVKAPLSETTTVEFGRVKKRVNRGRKSKLMPISFGLPVITVPIIMF